MQLKNYNPAPEWMKLLEECYQKWVNGIARTWERTSNKEAFLCNRSNAGRCSKYE